MEKKYHFCYFTRENDKRTIDIIAYNQIIAIDKIFMDTYDIAYIDTIYCNDRKVYERQKIYEV